MESQGAAVGAIRQILTYGHLCLIGSIAAVAVALTEVAANGRAKRFYLVAEVADLLGLSEPTVYRAIRAGELPAIKVRGRYVVPAKAIDQMESDALASSSLVDAADYGSRDGAAAS